jgi:hypothetical protein
MSECLADFTQEQCACKTFGMPSKIKINNSDVQRSTIYEKLMINVLILLTFVYQ